jgi:hypothetical protein
MATITAISNGPWTTASGALFAGGIMPTAADDVIIPSGISLSATSGSPTAVCRSLTIQSGGSLGGLGQVFIGDASGGALTVESGASITMTTGAIRLISTSTNGGAGWPITTNGVTLANVVFDGVGGRWQLQDALTCSGSLTHTQGTFDTGNFNVTCHFVNAIGGSGTLTLGSSAITTNRWECRVQNKTITANTAVVTIPFAAGGFDNNNVGGGDYNGMSLVQSGSGACQLGFASGQTTTITLRNYTRTGTAATTDALNVATRSS